MLGNDIQRFLRLEEAADHLHRQLGQLQLVGIDGWMQTGKTPLAKLLACKHSGCHLDLDTFVARKKGKFVAALQLRSLAAAINNASVPVFVSGVCLLAVFRKLGIELDSHIYLKRLGAGIWADENEILGDSLAKYEQAGIEPCPLSYEVRDYHLEYLPHEQANHVIELADGALLV